MQRKVILTPIAWPHVLRKTGLRKFSNIKPRRNMMGIVKLTSAKQKRDARRVHCSCPSDLRPQVHRRCAQLSMMVGGDVVARDVEEVGNRIMDGNEALQMPL